MAVSEKIKQSIAKGSFIRRMFEEGIKRKLKYGRDNVFDFSLGNPNLEPPAKVKQVLHELIDDPSPGRHGYMPNAGLPETKQAVADHLNKFNQTRLTADEIVMSAGAGAALNLVLKTILNPGDEVIIPSPYFFEYNFYLDNYQGVPKIVRTKSDFMLDVNRITENISQKTKAVLINSPNNPTGRVYSEKVLQELASALSHYSQKSGEPIYLISDEPYRKIVYDSVFVPSIVDVYNDTIVATSFSKDLSLGGERIGYVAVNPSISEKETILAGLVLCTRVLGYVNAPALMQRAVRYLLEETVDVSIYKKRRDMLCAGLGSIGYEFTRPEGAFYLFPKTPIADDVAFVSALKEENILVVPGSGFDGPGHFRIAYCVSDEVIQRALPGFAKVLKQY
jgi:aspartate aminotransferase